MRCSSRISRFHFMPSPDTYTPDHASLVPRLPGIPDSADSIAPLVDVLHLADDALHALNLTELPGLNVSLVLWNDAARTVEFEQTGTLHTQRQVTGCRSRVRIRNARRRLNT